MPAAHSTSAARLAAVFAFVTATAAAVPAQNTTVSPRGFHSASGGNTTGYPWGYTGTKAFRYQETHDALTGSPKLIFGIAVRRKEGGAVVWPAINPELEVSLSTAALSSQAAVATYAANHGTDLKIVLTKKIVSFPAVNPPGNLPAPFTYRMVFDVPFIYLGQGSLCHEIVMSNNDWVGGTTLNLDLAQNAIARNQPFGGGCGGASLTGTFARPSFSPSAAGLPPSTAAVLLVSSGGDTYGGARLPLDLGPAGAPGCSLFVGPILFLVQLTSASGAVTFMLDTSGAPADLLVHLQVLAIAPAANPMGLVFTNGLLSSPLVPATFMRNWNANVTLPTGNLQKIYALVTQYTHT